MISSMRCLQQDIDQDRLRPVYLFYGPEEFLKERAVQEILRKMVTPDLKEFNLDVLYGDETNAATIVDRAASLPMMAERRFILVRNVDRLLVEERRKILEYSASSAKRKLLEQLERDIQKKEKELKDRKKKPDLSRSDSAARSDGSRPTDLLEQRDELLARKREVLQGLNFAFPHACLLLTADDGDVVRMFYRGGRKKRTPGTRKSTAKAVGVQRTGRATPGGTSGLDGQDSADEPWLNVFADRIVAGVNFRSLSETRVPGMVDQLARDHGKSIAPRAVELLVQAIGSDLVAVDNELAKLSIYIADRPEITSRDVEAVVGEMKVRSVWDLCDAVLSGRTVQSFSLLGRLLESGLAVPQLTGALRWRLSQQLSGRGRGWAGHRPKASDECLEKAFNLLYETEFSANTGRQSARMAMTLLIDRLCRLFGEEER